MGRLTKKELLRLLSLLDSILDGDGSQPEIKTIRKKLEAT